ncbi:voltage-dependent calcium channel subunit alpha-2/delta-2-like isoform X2 [Dreissena polymorpha]|uniref:voltage-dependent calcium channel subunit alpha-2/delta-2-like isoform X2 n=1 Tax=Dreissena polymorpha TaxID=45954 RepID=UPI002264C7ED|nr:voltage-dependent calcium channel subunit alpha-2/delta-2-like isoform X2 [Dreissena polymorpha]
MATKMLIKYSFIYLFVYANIRVVNAVIPDKRQLTQWAYNLKQQLDNEFKAATSYSTLPDAYNNKDNLANSPFKLTFEKIDPAEMVKTMADKLSAMLKSKMMALNASVAAAEKAAKEHVWNNNIQIGDFFTLKSKDIKDNDTGLEYSERFKQYIIPNMSSVHIPVEIYDGDVEILNGLKWTAALDEVFSRNVQNDPDILWQYFGSQSGFMRTLPAAKWDTRNKVDLFDVRRRPWYTQGSSSPKDMLILIDVSGSVHGQALEMMKVAAESLINTLGENDFVNVAQFSVKASHVSECFKGNFVQANYRNKQKLIKEVQHIEASGMADYTAGLTFAFELFENLKNQTDGLRGAECNRMIMLLTDGGTELAEDVFKKYNPPGNKRYRVFTYAVGQTANPVSAIRWMACANRGYFSQIQAMGAVTSKVQEYLDVPLQMLQKFHLTFKEQVQFVLKIDPRGLGMMTTVTLPVYNRTLGTANQTILGVMGVDVTTAAMLKLAPHRKFGPNGFAFSINSNGFIVFHPKLEVKTDFHDPPDVDFLEVEIESEEKELLRKRMIDMETGTVSMDSYAVSDDKRHVDSERDDGQRIYSFRPIEETTFSLGVSLPKYHQHHLTVNLTENVASFIKKNADLVNMSDVALLIAKWDYYENYIGSENRTGTILDLLNEMEDHSFDKWNPELISHLLYDLNVTAYIHDYWKVSKNPSIVGAFVSTLGGLTAVYPKSDELLEQFLALNDTWKASYFKRALNTNDLLFSAPHVIDPKREGNNTVGDVMVVASVVMDSSKLDPSLQGQLKVAVTGAIFSHHFIQDQLIRNVEVCNSSSTVACHLLDDGAFLIATNQPHLNTSVGRFFGKVDPEVMSELFNDSFFLRHEQYDYGAVCEPAMGNTTSAGTLNIPSLALLYEFLTFNWWSSVVTWMFTNFSVYNLISPSPAFVVEASQHKTQHCTKESSQYYYGTSSSWSGNTTDCEVKLIQCSREYIVQRVNGTNLLLVVTELPRDGCDPCKVKVDMDNIIQEPTVIPLKKSDEHFCELKPRYRRKTSHCYDNHTLEDDSKCRGSQTHPLSFLTMLVTTATLLLVTR